MKHLGEEDFLWGCWLSNSSVSVRCWREVPHEKARKTITLERGMRNEKCNCENKNIGGNDQKIKSPADVLENEAGLRGEKSYVASK